MPEAGRVSLWGLPWPEPDMGQGPCAGQGCLEAQLWAPSCQAAGGSAILGQGQEEPELKAWGSTGNLHPSPVIAFHCVSPAGPRTGHPEGQLRGLQSSLSLFLLNSHTRVKLMVPAGAGLWVGPLAVSLLGRAGSEMPWAAWPGVGGPDFTPVPLRGNSTSTAQSHPWEPQD